jgi:nondiscriminating aspartyl-tRNA synthetase
MIKTHSCGELRKEHVSRSIRLSGWVSALRNYGKISFIDIRDRDGITQLFLNKDLTEKFKTLTRETVIEIKGIVNARPDNQINKDLRTGEVEVEVKELSVITHSETPLPIEIEEETTTAIDKRLDYRFLDLRRKKISTIFRIRSKAFLATATFFDKNGFVNIQNPKLTASGVESGAEEFKLPYFGKEASLAQSPQVYKQMMVVSGLERVYEIGTVFRAEKSHTTRHLTEFTGIDFEMGFIENIQDVMHVAQEYMRYLSSTIKNTFPNELKEMGVEILAPDEFPQMTLDQAKEILLTKHNKTIPEGEDLDAEGEKMIGKYVKEKYNSDFVFMLEYPWEKRPFYHMRDDRGIPKSFDLLFKGVEIATGAQREHRLEILEAQCKEKGLDLSKMDFYKNIFRYGCPPHGGIGMGFDRIIQRMLDLDNVREAILLPRDPERLTP